MNRQPLIERFADNDISVDDFAALKAEGYTLAEFSAYINEVADDLDIESGRVSQAIELWDGA